MRAAHPHQTLSQRNLVWQSYLWDMGVLCPSCRTCPPLQTLETGWPTQLHATLTASPPQVLGREELPRLLVMTVLREPVARVVSSYYFRAKICGPSRVEYRDCDYDFKDIEGVGGRSRQRGFAVLPASSDVHLKRESKQSTLAVWGLFAGDD